jgi:hypothetical protein
MNKIEFMYYSDLNGLPVKMDCEYIPLHKEHNTVRGDYVIINTIEVNINNSMYNIINFIDVDLINEMSKLAFVYFHENYELTITANIKA